MAEWYYERGGSRHGPIAADQLQEMYRQGDVGDATLVWNKEFGQEWKKYGAAGLVDAQDQSPPPLPSTHVNGLYAWIFALMPAIGLGIEHFMTDTNGTPVPDQVVYGGYFVAYVVLGWLDAKQIERSGRNSKSISLGWLIWLAPAYLIQRARALSQGQFLFIIWLACFVGAAYVEMNGMLDGKLYLGLGMPTCDATASESQVREIVETIPLISASGAKVIQVSNISEVSSSDKQRSCRASVTMSSSATFPVTYTITDQDNQYLYQLQISP